jgi:23S rRNA (cytidine2498-2'-O)-methyltransferase
VETIPEASSPVTWLIRISEVFAEHSREIIGGLGGTLAKRLGSEYYLLKNTDGFAMRDTDAALLVRWNLPVEHAWPCNPENMEGFVEKAAQALFRKFGARGPQALFIGQLDPSAGPRYYKALASNLRGRTLQLFPEAVASFREVEAQASKRETLFCLVGKEGLFCGMQSPLESNGLYPGGTKYISQNSPDTISRAGAKIAEALHFLAMYRPLPEQGASWLELGASPGGMTSELLARGYQVTALDRAPLDKRLSGHPGLEFSPLDAADFRPTAAMRYDAILSDMNGDPRAALGQVLRLARNLKPGGVVIFTLKTQAITGYGEILQLHRDARKMAVAAGMRVIATTHLTYNRQEVTLFLERDRDDPVA